MITYSKIQKTLFIVWKYAICLGFVYFTYLMILITIQYIPISYKAAFLGIKQEEIELSHYKLAFFTHVYSSIFVLILGFFQFSKRLRSEFASFHRNLGKLYILLILVLAGPSGLVIGYFANGGLSSKISFSLLAILWMYFTWASFKSIQKKSVLKHRNYMIRSYALTLSAISLRLFKWGFAHFLALPPMDNYKIVSWAGWVFNLLVAEILIWRFSKKSSTLNPIISK